MNRWDAGEKGEISFHSAEKTLSLPQRLTSAELIFPAEPLVCRSVDDVRISATAYSNFKSVTH